MWSRLLAVAAVAAVLFGFATHRLEAEPGQISGEIPQGGGLAAIVWGGGRVDALQRAALTRGCSPASAWVFRGGRAIGHLFEAPAFVNRGFSAEFPSGDVPAGTIVLLVCQRPSTGPVAGPTASSPPPSESVCADEAVSPPLAPNARFHYAIAWDEDARRLFLFGGDDGTLSNELWSFCPETGAWRLLVTAGPSPSPRYNHTMVWDPGRHRLLVFGGVQDRKLDGPSGVMNEIWAFTPATSVWEQVVPKGDVPAARGAHTAVWDSVRDQMVVFGGQFGDAPDLFGDLWTYNPTSNTWQEILAGGPAPGPRQGHSAVWAPSVDRMLVFGGWDFAPGTQPGSDNVWSFDPVSVRWAHLQPAGARPAPRLRHAAAWDTRNSEMLIFGGIPAAAGWLSDTWAFSPASNLWIDRTPSTSPPPTNRVRAAWDPRSARMFVYGGIGHCFLKDDLWVYSGAERSWQRIGSAPTPILRREGAAAVYDVATETTIVFGGCDGSTPNNDLVALSQTTRTATIVRAENPPPPRTDHRAAWDPVDRAMYVFGGRGPTGTDGGYLGDLWRYRATAGVWERLSPRGSGPVGRADFAMAWDPSNHQLLVFGGVYGPGALGDLWAYRPGEDQWAELTPNGSKPSERGYPLGAWDSTRSRLLVYGGWVLNFRFGKVLFKEIWAYDSAADEWKRYEQTTPQPSLRTRGTIAWDSSGERLLLFGGEVTESSGVDIPHISGQLWAWLPSDNTWSLVITDVSPSPRYEYAAAWDPVRAILIVLGGYGAGLRADVWEYSSRSTDWRRLD